MAKNWSQLRKGFVDGFINGYHLATKADGTGFDGAAVRRLAEAQANEHVRLLKEAEETKPKDAPLDPIFKGE